MSSNTEPAKKPTLLPALSVTQGKLISGFNQISAERKLLLDELTQFVQSRIKRIRWYIAGSGQVQGKSS